jgi:hypothetical protein
MIWRSILLTEPNEEGIYINYRVREYVVFGATVAKTCGPSNAQHWSSEPCFCDVEKSSIYSSTGFMSGKEELAGRWQHECSRNASNQG